MHLKYSFQSQGVHITGIPLSIHPTKLLAPDIIQTYDLLPQIHILILDKELQRDTLV